jgi:hypothetical protein
MYFFIEKRNKLKLKIEKNIFFPMNRNIKFFLLLTN